MVAPITKATLGSGVAESAAARRGGGRMSGTLTEAGPSGASQAGQGLAVAGRRIVAESLSHDSATFLARSRQAQGE